MLRHRSSGLFPAKSEPRKFRSGKDFEESRRPGYHQPPCEFNFGQRSPRVEIVCRDISRLPFEMGLGKTRSSKLSFQTLLDALAGIDKTFNQSKQFSYDIDYKGGRRGRKISISFRLTKVTIYVNRDV